MPAGLSWDCFLFSSPKMRDTQVSRTLTADRRNRELYTKENRVGSRAQGVALENWKDIFSSEMQRRKGGGRARGQNKEGGLAAGSRMCLDVGFTVSPVACWPTGVRCEGGPGCQTALPQLLSHQCPCGWPQQVTDLCRLGFIIYRMTKTQHPPHRVERRCLVSASNFSKCDHSTLSFHHSHSSPAFRPQ